MTETSTADGQTFSSLVGLLYVFNLIVGTGALALPRAFQNAGYFLSVLLLFVSALVSYVCATFVIESMSIANSVLNKRKRQTPESTPSFPQQDGGGFNEGFESDAQFEITHRVELSEMSHMFLGRLGALFTYFVLTIYLFGDLAIYSTTVPKSLMNVVCSSLNVSNFTRDSPCHFEGILSRFDVYRICVCLFVAVCLPMVLIGMTRTKYLQLSTTLSRWTAFVLMIVLASLQLAQDGPKANPPAENLHGFGSLFGVAVYAFMCHHSIPGLITPIRDKSFISAKLISVYVLIFAFYCTLSITGSFAFPVVQDIYTLNFFHDEHTGGVGWWLVDYFLALFPVFTLTSSYIIVAITLANNVRVLISLTTGKKRSSTIIGGQDHDEHEELLNGDGDSSAGDHPMMSDILPIGSEVSALRNGGIYPQTQTSAILSAQVQLQQQINQQSTVSAYFQQYGVPLLVVLLPTVLSFFTDNVLLLASVTGSFPGVGVQFVIPATLIVSARRFLNRRQHLGDVDVLAEASVPAHIRSPFAHWLWPFAVLGWAAFAIAVVSTNIFHLG